MLLSGTHTATMPIWTPNLAGQPDGRQQRIEACSEQGLRVGVVEGSKAFVLSSATIGGLYYFSPWFKKATRIRCGRAALAGCPSVAAVCRR